MEGRWPRKRLIHNAGIYEDGSHKAFHEDGMDTHLYLVWKGMIKRCFVPDKRRPNYAECEVHESFMRFQDFGDWTVRQIGHRTPGFQIDKDVLIKGNKLYGPETCVFVPMAINNLHRSSGVRNGFPIGVGFIKSSQRYTAKLQADGKAINLGTYPDPISAFHAYKDAKEERIRQVAGRWRDKIDPRAYHALMNWKIEITD